MQVAAAWGLIDDEYERLLRWGALLHEIGMDVSHSQYHKHGHYLLQYMDLAGFSQTEKLRLALLVRAHRRKFPVLEFERDRRRRADHADAAGGAAASRGRCCGEIESASRCRASHCSADGNRLKVSIPAEWLDAHPLTRLDLEQESEFLEAVCR